MVEKKSSHQLQDAPLKSRRGSPDYLLLAAKTQRFTPHKDADSPRTAASLKPSSKVRGARMKRSWRKFLNSAEVKEAKIHHQVAASATIDHPVAVSLSTQLKSIKDETHHVPRFSSAPATSEQSGTSGEKSLKRIDHELSLIDEELECSGESPHPLEKKTAHDVEFVWDELDLEWATVDLPPLLDVEATVITSVLMKESIY